MSRLNEVYLHQLDKVISVRENELIRLNGKSILIIGASGLIGTFLIDVLMRFNQKHEGGVLIFGMARDLTKLKNRFSEYKGSPFFSFVQGDVTNELNFEGQIDYILHGASNTHPMAYATDPVGTILTNVLGTKSVMDFAGKSKAQRVLFLSSVEIYGENVGDVELFDEQYLGYIDSNTVRAGYPEAKRVSESLIQAYRSQFGLNAVIARLSRVFGPTMQSGDSKALSQFILNGVNGQDIVLKSTGTQRFSYTYVGDAVSAILLLLFSGDDGAAYNVSDASYNLSLGEMAELISDISSTKVVYELPDEIESKGYSKATRALMDATKLNQIGWRPVFDMHEAISETINILKEK
ncbi:NAD-dependent epimerase/dehydratase family protein [Weissella confusa]|uniref:NAD-dependent epimerase/dehydratase family protein n=1 Tax=Weissella confusa TaxID=1583 RepID=UPI0003070D17|nr:NAD-dependent epimerase/dehydratase family protein [Weissella confusa]MBJ7616605.1 NAD-dependent epimerase/dehydratase family protein [Weissella confusa]MBJ7627224.1 NAD-dependent epimerase/dehydratase family protein [Weissella confusa]MCT8392521.1 NAD-dependent epimerase/dehydratase family protein [Weissella confusa]